jgi:hypothetical protein
MSKAVLSLSHLLSSIIPEHPDSAERVTFDAFGSCDRGRSFASLEPLRFLLRIMSSHEDLIVVDDIADQSSYGETDGGGKVTGQSVAAPIPTSTSGMTTRRRTSAAAAGGIIGSSMERTTRSAANKLKGQPKLKLKLSDKASAQVSGMSFLGAYDRELDSSDDDLTFEEQFILRMPPGEDCERLRKAVSSREISNDVWFKFKGEPCSSTRSTVV